MIDDVQVPDEFLGAFRRLVRGMPVELQTDEAFIQTLVMYLKLGGVKLASHRIEVEKAEFPTAFTIVKRQPVEDTEDTDSDDDDEDEDEDEERDDADEMDSDSDEVEDIDPDKIAS
jgi:Ran GTPase-activating protein (RanGAP) involved in mRNA processing and transport